MLTIKSMKSAFAWVFALGIVAVASIGCAVPASVDGVVQGDGFSLRCTSPLSKPNASGRDTVVVLAEQDSETLRTVTVTLHAVADMPLGTPVAVGTGDDGLSSVQVAYGDKVVETRKDGVELVSSVNNVFSGSVGGTVILDERTPDEISGHFRVDLDDGGYLEGVFTAFPST